MLHRLQDRRLDPRSGYALILAMVALVALTLVGVTAIGVSQLDLKITSNMRHHRQVAYGALTGLDHGRDLFSDNLVEISETIESAGDQPSGCLEGWIADTGPNVVAAPLILDANGFPLASYTVDFCVASCGLPPSGTSLGEGIVGFTVDIVSTGQSPTTAATSDTLATQGAFVVGTLEPATCDGDKT